MDIYVAQSVSFCLALPSVLLYVAECAVIVRFWHQCFNTSFFRLFLLSAANNLLLNFVLYIPVWRINQLGLFYEQYRAMPDWVPKMFFVLSFFTFHFENLLTIVVIAHRLSAILCPINFEQLWNRFLPIFVAVGVIICLALTSPIMLKNNIHFNSVNTTRRFHRITVSYRFKPGEEVFNAYQFLFICSVLALATSTVLNLATIFAYKWHKTIRTATLAPQRQAEHRADALQFRLLAYTVAMFIGQLLYLAYYIIAYLFSVDYVLFKHVWSLVVNQYIWLNDLRVLVFPSWFLYWASTEVYVRTNALFAAILTSIKDAIGKFAKLIANVFVAVKTALLLVTTRRGWHNSMVVPFVNPNQPRQLAIITISDQKPQRRATHPYIVERAQNGQQQQQKPSAIAASPNGTDQCQQTKCDYIYPEYTQRLEMMT